MLEPGDMFGDYAVEKLLGKGGMGAVYLVRAPGGELFALKVMDAEAARKNQDFLKRFLREGEFAVRIRHPNLIAVHRVGKDEKTGFCYLVMDYMPGGSLADRLDKCKRLSVDEAISIVVQIAAALEVAHRNGVVHRDIKPGNIMFDIDGTPKLADLGVAKFSDGAYKTTMTTTGMIIGTPAYMAPEQMLNSHKVDSRADIYSLGVVFYEMLAGKRPNEDSTAVELLAKAIKGDTLPDVRTMRPEVSAALAYVLSLMCAPKPENRPSTPNALVELCQRAVNGTLDVPRERVVPQVPRRRGGRSLHGSFVVAAAILAAGAVGWGTVKVAQRLMPGDGQQVRAVTNTVDHIVHVTNTVRQGVPITKSVDVIAPDGHGESASSPLPIPAKDDPVVSDLGKEDLALGNLRRVVVKLPLENIVNKTNNKAANFRPLVDHLRIALEDTGLCRVMIMEDGKNADQMSVIGDDGTKILTSEFFICMLITTYGLTAVGEQNPLAGSVSGKEKAKIELTLKVADVRTGETILSKNIASSCVSGGIDVASNRRAQILQVTTQKACEKIVYEIVKLTPFGVLNVDEDVVSIDVPGSLKIMGAPLPLGTQFVVLKLSNRKSKRTGRVTHSETPVALLSLTSVGENSCLAQIISGSIPPIGGDEDTQYDSYIVKIRENVVAVPVAAPVAVPF